MNRPRAESEAFPGYERLAGRMQRRADGARLVPRDAGMKLPPRWRLGQLHPTAATAGGFRIRKTPDQLQPEDPHEGDVQSRRVVVLEALAHHALTQARAGQNGTDMRSAVVAAFRQDGPWE